MMLKKQQIQMIFLFEFKMGCKAAETTCNINNTCGPGTANQHTVNQTWWFKKFCKGDESLEDEECSGWPLEADSDQLRGSSKLILFTTTKEKLPKNSVSTILRHSAFEANWKGSKWVPHELTINQKNCHFEMSSSLFLCNNNEPFLNQIMMCDEKRTLYNNQWQWLDREEAPKHFPKSNLHQKNAMVTAWWSAAHPIHYSFLNPSETIIPENHAQKPMRCTANHNACSRHLSTEWAQLFSMTMPNHTSYNQCFKSWTNWAVKFGRLHHIHLTSCQLTTTSQQLFAGKMFPQPAGSRKCFLSVRWILKHGCLCYRNKQTYFLLAKMCWL